MKIQDTDIFMYYTGMTAWRVGGSVRDELRRVEPKDADYVVQGRSLEGVRYALTTTAKPGTSITKLTTRDGQQVGWRVGRPYNIEVVLPRREVSTGPGHGDFKIEVDPQIHLREDCLRRDFTFNALYVPIGPYGAMWQFLSDPTETGQYDVQRRIINTTHPDSFRDDPLRILRALRFVARGYDLSDDCQVEMRMHADAVNGLTADGHMSGTVYDEMCKILTGHESVKALRIMRDTGVMAVLFPELAPIIGHDPNSRHHDRTTDEHTFKALETAVKVDAPLIVRWALLFHDAGKPESEWVGPDGRKHFYASRVHDLDHGGETVMTEDHEVISERLWNSAAARMNVPSDVRKPVAKIVRNHMVPPTMRAVGVRARRMRVTFGDELLQMLLLHRTCDIVGKDEKVDKTHLQAIARLESERQAAVERGIPSSVRDLAINGRDVAEMGHKGADIGYVLQKVLDEVVVRADERSLDREWQMQRAKAVR